MEVESKRGAFIVFPSQEQNASKFCLNNQCSSVSKKPVEMSGVVKLCLFFILYIVLSTYFFECHRLDSTICNRRLLVR